MPDQLDDLLRDHAARLDAEYAAGRVGDYSMLGYLASFLVAVTPVIRQQVAEEIADAIHERFDHLNPEWHSNMIVVAEWCEGEARRLGEETTNGD